MPEPQLLKDAGNVIKHVAKLALPFLGFMQEGGPVTESGLYHLEEGEHVLPNPGGVVPGNAASTPPMFPSPSQAAAPTDDMTKRLLYAITRAVTQRRAAGTPHPVSVPGGMNPVPPASLTEGMGKPQANAQRFMYGIQANIRNGVARMKEQQVAKATADWEYAQSALNEYYAAQQSQDPQAMKAAQVKLDAAFGDPKKLKQMAKALNQDWLNPEKTTVYGDALKRVAAKTQQTEQQKEQAKQGIKGIFQKLIQKSQQPQLTDEEKKKMQQEVIDKAPTTPPGTVTPEIAKAIIPFVNSEERVAAQKQIQDMKDQANKEIEQMKEQAKKDLQKPVEKVLSEAQEAFGKGDMDTYQKKLKEAGQMSSAEKASTNQFALIAKANAGDPEAASTLKTYWEKQIALAKARGQGFAEARAQWQIEPYVDEKGQIIPMSNFDAMNAIHAGKTLTPAGKLSASMVTSVQRLTSEAVPAIQGMYKTTISDPKDPSKSIEVEPLKAFDNASDKAIFARLIASSPAAVQGQEFSWLGNIMNQALTEKLSPEGRAYAQNEVRLADTLGTLRAALGLPATQTMTELSMNLMPGASTPDSSFAKDKMKLLDQMVTNAVGIPALKGVTGAAGSAGKGTPGTTSFTDGGKTYNIPNDKVSAFKKDHPNAR